MTWKEIKNDIKAALREVIAAPEGTRKWTDARDYLETECQSAVEEIQCERDAWPVSHYLARAEGFTAGFDRDSRTDQVRRRTRAVLMLLHSVRRRQSGEPYFDSEDGNFRNILHGTV